MIAFIILVFVVVALVFIGVPLAVIGSQFYALFTRVNHHEHEGEEV